MVNATFVGEVKAADPERAALAFSAVLGADKGIASEVIREESGAWVVLADDGRAVRFKA